MLGLFTKLLSAKLLSSSFVCLGLFSLGLFSINLKAAEMETWDLMENTEIVNEDTSAWSDYAEAKPDLHPDTWRLATLANFDGHEVHLLNSRGAGLRWIATDQLKLINQTYQKVQKVAELKATLYIMRGDEPNAAAGERAGHSVIFINFGMLNLIGAESEQWAAIFGHELAHLKLEHGKRRAKRGLPLKILKAVSGAVIADPLTAMASQYMFDGLGSKFGRDEERQSDYMGVIWSIEAGYDAYGAADLHDKLLTRKTGLSIPFLNSHPSSRERVETLTGLADRLSPKTET